MEDVEADSSAADINVGVEARGIKLDCRRDIRIIRREGDGDLEAQSGVNLGQTEERVSRGRWLE